MRIAWIVLAVCVTVLLVFVVQTRTIQNPRVLRRLEREPDGALATRVLVLTLPSGKSIPVNYLLERDADGREIVHVASDFFWWRELRGVGAPVEVVIRNVRRRGHARANEDDPEHRRSIFDRLRPTAPGWFGVHVEIALENPTG